MSKNTKNEAVAVVADAATVREFGKLVKAEAKGYGALVAFIGEHARAAFQEPVSVSAFAAYMGYSLAMGKDVSEDVKAERNRIKARINYGLKSVGLLLQKKRQPKPEAKGKGKGTGEAAADAVAHAVETASTNGPDRFSALCAIMDAMDLAELDRAQNALTARRSAKLAEVKALAGKVAAEAAAKPAAPAKAAAKRKRVKAAA